MSNESPQRAQTKAYAPPPAATDATLLAPTNDGAIGTDATHLAPSTSTPGARAAFTPPTAAARTTVLPKVEGDGITVHLSLEHQGRYEPTKLLGTGGMGEVVLV